MNQFKQKLQNRKLLLAGSAIPLSLASNPQVSKLAACRPKGTGNQSGVLAKGPPNSFSSPHSRNPENREPIFKTINWSSAGAVARLLAPRLRDCTTAHNMMCVLTRQHPPPHRARRPTSCKMRCDATRNRCSHLSSSFLFPST